jgi:leucyl-tRNA synthetase
MLGEKGFVADAAFPAPDESRFDPLSEFREEFVRNVAEDIGQIIKVTKMSPRKLLLYSAPGWKWDVFRRAVAMASDGHLYMSGLMKALMEVPEIRPHAKELAKFAQKIVADIPKLSKELLAKYGLPLDEHRALLESREFFAGEFGCKVQCYTAGDPEKYDPQDKAKNAVPLRPAIFLEG